MRKLIIFTLLFFTALKGYSCSCAELPSIQENWERANEVFKGHIIKVDSTLYGNNGGKIYSYTIKILESYKQEFYPIRKFRTILSQDEAKCDFMFKVGKTYLIYSKTENNTLACSICSRTNLFENVNDEEIKTLEKLYKIYNTSEVKTERLESNILYQIGLVKNSFEEELKSKNRTIYILSGIIICLLILIAIVFLKRKNSR